MKKSLLILLGVLTCLAMTSTGRAQATLAFMNSVLEPVTNKFTGNPVPAGPTFEAGLYYAPQGVIDESQFMLLSVAPFVAPGLFNGGNVVVPEPAGSGIVVQVRVWETAFGGSYEAAAAAAADCTPVLIGKSAILHVQLGTVMVPATLTGLGAFGVCYPLCLEISRSGADVSVCWRAATPGFVLEEASVLAPAPDWFPVLKAPMISGTHYCVTLPVDGLRFFRVRSTTETLSYYAANLNGANERPTPVVTSGTGTGAFLLEGTRIWFRIGYGGLSSGTTAAHLHAPAGIDGTAGPTLNLGPFHVGPLGGQSGRFLGTANLTTTQRDWVATGMVYVNIHTTQWGGGEIRGQILPP